MNVLAAGFAVIGCVIGAGAMALYGITAKAQQPRILPNASKPVVPYEAVEWQSEGHTVSGWILPQPGHIKAPAILVAHGWGSNRARMLRYAQPLHEEGYAVLLYDARSHGESDAIPAPSGFMFRDDLLSALDWLRNRQDIDSSRIGVIGHSLGGFGAVLALEAGARIAALVTDAMPVRFDTMIAAELKRRKLPRFPLAYVIPRLMMLRSKIAGAALKRANPSTILAENAKGRNIPVLLVHSRRDGFIPASEMEHVLTRTPELPHLFVNVEGHSTSERDPAFWPAVMGFFRIHLAEDKENGLAASAASPSSEIY